MEAERAVTLRAQIRELKPPDYEAVLAIERLCFEDPWSNTVLTKLLKTRDHFGRIAVIRGESGLEEIVGYAVWCVTTSKLSISNLCVHPDYRRKRVGAQLLHEIVANLDHKRVTRATVLVREGNLGMQVFLRGFGWRCSGTIGGVFQDEDAYEFTYAPPVGKLFQFHPLNRISKYLAGR